MVKRLTAREKKSGEKEKVVVRRPGDDRRHRGGTDTWAWPLAAGYQRQIARAKGENREIPYSPVIFPRFDNVQLG